MNIDPERVFQIVGQLFVENAILREQVDALKEEIAAARAVTNGKPATAVVGD